MDESGFAIDASADAPRGTGEGVAVAFPITGGIRTEVERGPAPFDEWWRARVLGGEDWHVPTGLPWSYGTSERLAVDAALSLWAVTGQPGMAEVAQRAHNEERREAPDPASADDVDPGDAEPAEDADQIAPTGSVNVPIGKPGTKVLAYAADGTRSIEHDVTQSVHAAVRAVAQALRSGAQTVTLTRTEGKPLELKLASLIEIRDNDVPGTGAGDDDPDSADVREKLAWRHS